MTLIRHDAHGQVAEVFVAVQQAIGRQGEATDGDGETVFFCADHSGSKVMPLRTNSYVAVFGRNLPPRVLRSNILCNYMYLRY